MRIGVGLALALASFVAVARPSVAEDPVKDKVGNAPKKANRLATERSPYLRQHMWNPVDWRPWGAEAFEVAQRTGKPVFLSIGYAACHWCHVMEHESFEDEGAAAALNEAFVCVKVDREERPDVDDVYMAAVQVSSGRGGWPMTCLLTPEGKPFLARTYLPRAALLDLTRKVRDLWRTDRARLSAAADEIADAVRSHAAGPDLPPWKGSDGELVAFALERARAEFDAERGGFDRVPKFPPHAHLLYLLDKGGATGGPAGLSMARKTLDAMASGGVRDLVGGGFHRYSTDAEWLVPHFEKMLYDNALLARAYVEAYAVGKEPRYAKVARETLAWIAREMAVLGGGYASSLDADTEGVEGATYTWTTAELAETLGGADARLAAKAFGAIPAGNYAEEASGHMTHTNILHLPVPLPELARGEGRSDAEVEADLDRIRARLLAARAKRAQPGRDGKVLTSWNGLLLGALARAGKVLGDPALLERAKALATFLLAECRDGGRLLRFPKGSGPAIFGFLDDHAHLADGLLDLSDATGDAAYAAEAKALADAILARFADPAGGFFSTATDHETLLARPKDAFDSPIPSGNAVAARVFLRLFARGGGDAYRDACDRSIAAFRALVSRAPTGTMAFVRVIADRQALAAAGAVAETGDLSTRRGPAAIEVFLERGEARAGTKVRLLVRVKLDASFHVNAAKASRPELIATSLAPAAKGPAALVDVVYPAARSKPPGPGQSAIDLYEGVFEIRAALSIPAGSPAGPRKVGIVLTFQPCDETACQAPEEVRLDVPIRFGEQDGPNRHPSLFP